MGWSTTVIVPPDGNMTAYIESLKKILDYDYKTFSLGCYTKTKTICEGTYIT